MPLVDTDWRVVAGDRTKPPNSIPSPAARSTQVPSAKRPPSSVGSDTDVPPICTLVPGWPSAPGSGAASEPAVTSGVGCGASPIFQLSAAASIQYRSRPVASSAPAGSPRMKAASTVQASHLSMRRRSPLVASPPQPYQKSA
jgi:hypothetical protein